MRHKTVFAENKTIRVALKGFQLGSASPSRLPFKVEFSGYNWFAAKYLLSGGLLLQKLYRSTFIDVASTNCRTGGKNEQLALGNTPNTIFFYHFHKVNVYFVYKNSDFVCRYFLYCQTLAHQHISTNTVIFEQLKSDEITSRMVFKRTNNTHKTQNNKSKCNKHLQI